MDCSQEVFDKLWNGNVDQECKEFVYTDAIDELEPVGKFYIAFSEIKKKHLDDWNELDNWIQDLGLGLNLEHIDKFTEYAIENMSPRQTVRWSTKSSELTSDIDELEKLVAQAYSDYTISADNWGVGCIELTDGNRVLFLIFDGGGGLTFENEPDFYVTKSLDDLTETQGYYSSEPTITYELHFCETTEDWYVVTWEEDAVEDVHKKEDFYQALMAFFKKIKPLQEQTLMNTDMQDFLVDVLEDYIEECDSYLEAMEKALILAQLSCTLMRIENGDLSQVISFMGSYDPDKDYLYDTHSFDSRLSFQSFLDCNAIYFKELSDAQIESVKASFNQPNCWGLDIE
jgi:hypothetical protein